jgi:antirestriction protein ArdC
MANEKAKQKLSSLILEALDKNIVPWQKGWLVQNLNKGISAKNFYKGQNAAATEVARQVRGYKSHIWLTFFKFKELQKLNPSIRMKAGSKSVTIVLWKEVEEKDDYGNPKLNSLGQPVTRWVSWMWDVFNGDCFENLPLEEPDENVIMTTQQFEEATQLQNALLSSYKDHPPVYYDAYDRAYYDMVDDSVHLQAINTFTSVASFAQVLAHELSHSTGSKERLDRKLAPKYFLEEYSFEELVAEISSCIVLSRLGLLNETIQNSAAYINSWKKSIKANPNWFWDAFKLAEKASELILENWTEAEVAV